MSINLDLQLFDSKLNLFDSDEKLDFQKKWGIATKKVLPHPINQKKEQKTRRGRRDQLNLHGIPRCPHCAWHATTHPFSETPKNFAFSAESLSPESHLDWGLSHQFRSIFWGPSAPPPMSHQTGKQCVKLMTTDNKLNNEAKG